VDKKNKSLTKKAASKAIPKKTKTARKPPTPVRSRVLPLMSRNEVRNT
jgi:hypothetical protein